MSFLDEFKLQQEDVEIENEYIIKNKIVNNAKIKKVSNLVSKQISNNQVVINLANAVKELVENAIDAKATRIEIKLGNKGIDFIEVIDNGKGVQESELSEIVKKHHTSKIKNFDDINKVKSFGFRGEALSSICQIAQDFTIISRTENDAEFGHKADYHSNGSIRSIEKIARQQGTTVLVKNLFDTIPVRRSEFIRTIDKSYQKLLVTIQAYALISENVRITLTNIMDKKRSLVLATTGGAISDLGSNISSVFGAKFLRLLRKIDFSCNINNQLQENKPRTKIADNQQQTKRQKPKTKWMDLSNEYTSSGSQLSSENSQILDEGVAKSLKGYQEESEEQKPQDKFEIRLTGYISQDSKGIGRVVSERQFLYLNGRPVDLKRLSKTIKAIWKQYETNSKPAFILNLILPPGYYDVNVTPDKREVYIADEDLVMNAITEQLHSLWKDNRMNEIQSSTSSQQQNIEKSMSKIKSANPMKQMQIDFNTTQQEVVIPSPPSISKPKLTTTTTTTTNSIPILPEDDSEIELIKHKPIVVKDNNDVKNAKPVNLKKKISSPENVTSHLNNSDNSTKNSTKKNKRKKLQSDDEVEEEENFADELDFDKIKEKSPVKLRKKQQTKKAMIKLSRPSPITINENNIEARIKEMYSKKKNEQEQTRDMFHFNSYNDETNALINSQTVPNQEEVEEEVKLTFSKSDFPKCEIIGQFNLGFIIVRLKNSLYILDQHACDERYRFETLQQSTTIHVQNLMRPLPLDLSAVEIQTIKDNQDIFLANGFEFLESANNNQVRLLLKTSPHTYSTQFGARDVKELTSILIEHPPPPINLRNKNYKIPRPPKMITMFQSRACRGAVMIGTPLNRKEMKKIVSQMEPLEIPWACAHLRPSIKLLQHQE